MGLECFVCSELDSIPCPNSNSDFTSWKADTQKYVSHDPATSTDGLSCGIIIGGKIKQDLQSNLTSLALYLEYKLVQKR